MHIFLCSGLSEGSDQVRSPVQQFMLCRSCFSNTCYVLDQFSSWRNIPFQLHATAYSYTNNYFSYIGDILSIRNLRIYYAVVINSHLVWGTEHFTCYRDSYPLTFRNIPRKRKYCIIDLTWSIICIFNVNPNRSLNFDTFSKMADFF